MFILLIKQLSQTLYMYVYIQLFYSRLQADFMDNKFACPHSETPAIIFFLKISYLFVKMKLLTPITQMVLIFL